MPFIEFIPMNGIQGVPFILFRLDSFIRCNANRFFQSTRFLSVFA